MKRTLKGVITTTTFSLILLASPEARAATWTCHATIFLSGTNQQYTPSPWKMSAPGISIPDREKRCRQHIESNFLTGSIWSHFTLTPAEQDRICKSGNATFRIEYGFDRRTKSWQFTKVLPSPPCDCESRCKTGYDLDNRSSPGNPRCIRKLCDTSGIPDQRFGPHENGIGIWQNGIYHHQPVERGLCKFR
ncbi:MAG TPA: hypothetical protein VF789_05320 [Thermoanaerobaculia bacterium]